jgi:cytochrome bd-type quinol oxidase subunit 2
MMKFDDIMMTLRVFSCVMIVFLSFRYIVDAVPILRGNAQARKQFSRIIIRLVGFIIISVLLIAGCIFALNKFEFGGIIIGLIVVIIVISYCVFPSVLMEKIYLPDKEKETLTNTLMFFPIAIVILLLCVIFITIFITITLTKEY